MLSDTTQLMTETFRHTQLPYSRFGAGGELAEANGD